VLVLRTPIGKENGPVGRGRGETVISPFPLSESGSAVGVHGADEYFSPLGPARADEPSCRGLSVLASLDGTELRNSCEWRRLAMKIPIDRHGQFAVRMDFAIDRAIQVDGLALL
jgi:hypothetical protein